MQLEHTLPYIFSSLTKPKYPPLLLSVSQCSHFGFSCSFQLMCPQKTLPVCFLRFFFYFHSVLVIFHCVLCALQYFSICCHFFLHCKVFDILYLFFHIVLIVPPGDSK